MCGYEWVRLGASAWVWLRACVGASLGVRRPVCADETAYMYM